METALTLMAAFCIAIGLSALAAAESWPDPIPDRPACSVVGIKA